MCGEGGVRGRGVHVCVGGKVGVFVCGKVGGLGGDMCIGAYAT